MFIITKVSKILNICYMIFCLCDSKRSKKKQDNATNIAHIIWTTCYLWTYVSIFLWRCLVSNELTINYIKSRSIHKTEISCVRVSFLDLLRNNSALSFLTIWLSRFGPLTQCGSSKQKIFKILACFFIFYVFFLVSALFRDCSLCWDRWCGTWLLHLTRPC